MGKSEYIQALKALQRTYTHEVVAWKALGEALELAEYLDLVVQHNEWWTFQDREADGLGN